MANNNNNNNGSGNGGDLVVRYIVFLAALYVMAFGVVLIVRSNLGTTPISSANYVLSINTPLTLGTCTFLTNLIYVLLQQWMARGLVGRKDVVEIWLQIPLSFVFGAFIDLNMWLTASYDPQLYVLQMATLLVGCVVQALGIVMQLRPNVSLMSAEGFVKYFNLHFNARKGKRYEFGRTKVKLDVCLVLIAVALGLCLAGRVQGVREGTVIAALITGFIVNFISRYVFTERLFSRLKGLFLLGGKR